MKKLSLTITVFTVMFLIASCGSGSDSKNDDNNQNQSSAVCSYGEYECHGDDSYFCGYSGDDLIWMQSQACENGCDISTGKCNSGSNGNNDNPNKDNGGDTDNDSEEDNSSDVSSSWKDPDTNLIWTSLKSNGYKGFSWDEAVSYCENLDEDGHSDWRLPNIDESRTLIINCALTATGGSCKVSENCLSAEECYSTDCNGCPNNNENHSKIEDTMPFWTSSTTSDVTNLVWYVEFVSAAIGRLDKSHHESPVRCVRNAE
ncbi:DUF1566 domain-containing protein [bacterium]|nr:DUF1566 domain-containing protein [bacterium]MBQ4438125.1 DUF1566 domain-containing protein [bacterium]